MKEETMGLPGNNLRDNAFMAPDRTKEYARATALEAIQNAHAEIQLMALQDTDERALAMALTKLDEARLWLGDA